MNLTLADYLITKLFPSTIEPFRLAFILEHILGINNILLVFKKRLIFSLKKIINILLVIY